MFTLTICKNKSKQNNWGREGESNEGVIESVLPFRQLSVCACVLFMYNYTSEEVLGWTHMSKKQSSNLWIGCWMNILVLVRNSHVPHVQKNHSVNEIAKLLFKNSETSLPVVIPQNMKTMHVPNERVGTSDDHLDGRVP